MHNSFDSFIWEIVKELFHVQRARLLLHRPEIRVVLLYPFYKRPRNVVLAYELRRLLQFAEIQRNFGFFRGSETRHHTEGDGEKSISGDYNHAGNNSLIIRSPEHVAVSDAGDYVHCEIN